MPKTTKEIYMDYAAAAPITLSAEKAMIRALRLSGNPSSFHDAGREAAAALENARKDVARFLGAHEDEIVFTASGSEANSLAIFGVAAFAKKNCREIVTTPIEHLSVLEPIKALKRIGTPVRYVKINGEGILSISHLEKILSRKTHLVSIMYANNEIGTIEPIERVAKVIEAFRRKWHTQFPLFHVDACQAAGSLPMNVNQLGVDLLTLNSSKIGGPRGCGVLYVRRGAKIMPSVLGGGQEYGMRAGTENVPAIVGFAAAVRDIRRKDAVKIAALRDHFLSALPKVLREARITGPLGKYRLPNNIHITIPNLSSEQLLLELDRRHIRAGSGSACTARSVEPSHVLKAIGVRAPYRDGGLRLSIGRGTTVGDVNTVLRVLPQIVKKLKKRYGIS